MKVASLGSGSGGNSVLVQANGTSLLVDAGFSGVQIERRLRSLDVPASRIDALVVTHDHRDHTAGIGVAARRWGWPVYMSDITRGACEHLFRGGETVRSFGRGRPFRVGALEVRPFLTCHDAEDPLAVVVIDPERDLRTGLATDLGRPTSSVLDALAGCHFLVLEANHDEILLRDGPYPWAIKQRIGGSRGHLSNRRAALLADDLFHPELCGVLLAHLSRECNRPELARRAVEEALARRQYRGVLHVAEQSRPSPLFDLRLLSRRLRGPQLELFGKG